MLVSASVTSRKISRHQVFFCEGKTKWQDHSIFCSLRFGEVYDVSESSNFQAGGVWSDRFV